MRRRLQKGAFSFYGENNSTHLSKDDEDFYPSVQRIKKT